MTEARAELPPLPGAEAPITVAELNRLARRTVEGSLGPVWVEGEISRPTRHASGHLYFALKDASARVDAAMWRSEASRLAFEPAEGLKVLAFGQPTIWEPGGRWQIVVRRLVPAGLGALELRLRRLRAKLEAEGLFDPARKKKLPFLPAVLALVTSPTGAAVRDIIEVASRRHPRVRIVLAPARVQGEGAAEEVVRALESVVRHVRADVLIVGRGGGSAEDLQTFNEEIVVRAVAASPIPVISAVGHEIDVTLTDLAADARAATPSAAAGMAVPVLAEVEDRLLDLRRRAAGAIRAAGGAARGRLDALAGSYAIRRIPDRLREAGLRLDDTATRLRGALGVRARDLRARVERLALRTSMAPLRRRLRELRGRLAEREAALPRLLAARLRAARERLSALSDRSAASNPLSILARGYSITRVEGAGAPLRDAAGLARGTRLLTHLHRGTVISTVESTEPPAGDPPRP